MRVFVLGLCLVAACGFRVSPLAFSHTHTVFRRGCRVFSNNLDDLMIDYDKLSPKERERLDFIQKISKEADELARQAGFQVDINDDDDDDDIDNDIQEIKRSIRDTKWSGQSSVEESVLSTRTYSDMTSRIGLALGDVVSLLSFAAIGRSNHGEATDFIQLLTTAFPFVVTWLTLAPLLGAYSRDATSSRNKVFLGIIPAWIVSVPLALCLRGLIKGAIPPTPFIVVSLVSTYVILAAWRYLYVRLNGETSDKGDRQAGVFEIFKMVGTLMRRW